MELKSHHYSNPAAQALFLGTAVITGMSFKAIVRGDRSGFM